MRVPENCELDDETESFRETSAESMAESNRIQNTKVLKLDMIKHEAVFQNIITYFRFYIIIFTLLGSGQINIIIACHF